MYNAQHIHKAQEVFTIEIAALEKAKQQIGKDFACAVDLIQSISCEGRVIVMGMGKSGHIGNKIASTLASTGTPAFFVHPAEAGHGDLGMITQKDVIIAISHSGKSEELMRLIPYFKRNSIRIIALTAVATSPLATHADIVISTEVPQEACPLGLAPTASTTLTLTLGDALAVCLLQAKGFTQDQFAETHPHGTLGRKLLLGVREIMTPMEATPMIAPQAPIKEALFIMSQGALGFVIIVDTANKPLGVFTDGDLRRCLDRDINIKTTAINAVMSQNFVSLHEDQLAVKAVDLMEQHKISALPIIQKNGLVAGSINMRQLLQAGVV